MRGSHHTSQRAYLSKRHGTACDRTLSCKTIASVTPEPWVRLSLKITRTQADQRREQTEKTLASVRET